jgi:hypothetical protein
MSAVIDYRSPGPLTGIEEIGQEALAGLGNEPIEICAPVHALVIQPSDAEPLGLPADRFATNQVRPAAQLVKAILALDAAPLSSPREPDKRVIGTCRHFAVISCALLRRRGVAARARCGFATYFQPGRGLDHWVTEYWDHGEDRWLRIDSEILGGDVLSHPEDLQPGEFLSGGEAWAAFRQGEIDAASFGVHGTENWGPGEIRGNAVKDLAALNKVETLPWDVWGNMKAAYEDAAGPAYDDLLDDIAAACADDDVPAIAAFYERDDLRVPADLLR